MLNDSVSDLINDQKARAALVGQASNGDVSSGAERGPALAPVPVTASISGTGNKSSGTRG